MHKEGGMLSKHPVWFCFLPIFFLQRSLLNDPSSELLKKQICLLCPETFLPIAVLLLLLLIVFQLSSEPSSKKAFSGSRPALCAIIITFFLVHLDRVFLVWESLTQLYQPRPPSRLWGNRTLSKTWLVRKNSFGKHRIHTPLTPGERGHKQSVV